MVTVDYATPWEGAGSSPCVPPRYQPLEPLKADQRVVTTTSNNLLDLVWIVGYPLDQIVVLERLVAW